MGNKNNGGKLRSKNQPRKLLLSGDTTAIAVAVGGAKGGSASDKQSTLDIQLIQVALGVAAQVSVGDTVKLSLRGSSYEVDFQSQLLGQVPAHYNDELQPQRQYTGRLVRVAIYGDPIVIVRIRIKNK